MTKPKLELLPSGSVIPIFGNVASYRSWRKKAFEEGKTVGYVATMGALHEGHLSLVRRSLAANGHTVVSIFVNPAQFAPTEDLAAYPRTLAQDVKSLESVQVIFPSQISGETTLRTVSAIFAPSVSEMYPSGILQDVTMQRGTFVEVKGYGNQMEGVSRPTFFRGVATVVTKLFNVIQPDNTYFGQKDIQQALLLRRLCRDLLLNYPNHQNLHIVPTERDPTDGLALSSRNLYLSLDGRKVAATLRFALLAGESAWSEGLTKSKCLERATLVVEDGKADALSQGLQVEMRLDYIQMNYADNFEVLESDLIKGNDLVILSGALYVDRTRLIDNILLGATEKIFP